MKLPVTSSSGTPQVKQRGTVSPFAGSMSSPCAGAMESGRRGWGLRQLMPRFPAISAGSRDHAVAERHDPETRTHRPKSEQNDRHLDDTGDELPE